MRSNNYPETKRVDVSEEHFGHTIVDPYRWLENDVRSDEDVAEWVDAQNALTQRYLATLSGRDIFRERLAILLNYEQLTPPIKRGGRYFFTKNEGGDNQHSLWMRDDDGKDRIVIDPNDWSDDSADALGEWAASDDGRLLAFSVQSGGTDWRTIRVLDVDAGKMFDDQVHWARFTAIVWMADGSGFFYSRYPAPAEGTRATASVSNHAIYFHALGTSQADDRLVYSGRDKPAVLHIVDRTRDGRYLLVYATPGAGVNALAIIDLARDAWAPRNLIENFDAEWTVIGNRGDLLYLQTNEGAERRKIVTLDLALGKAEPVQLVAEDDAVLTNAALLGERLLTTYLVDAKTEIRRFALDGTPDGTVALAGIGSAGGFEGSEDDNEAFFVFSSFDTPMTVFRHDVAANRSEVWAEPNAPQMLRQISVSQRFYKSKDGTSIPISIVSHVDVTGPAPTLLYGYGGFGISMVPYYNPSQMAWVEQGGVLAIANIRGGGEYGRAWHMAGQFEKRQNSYDDFAAAGDFLKAEGITSANGLVIQGESNGGLLVGAVVNQRPDLFAAALPSVGVMDMVRYHRFSGGALWMSDFGSPDEERHFHALLSYSPYHNIRAGLDYPAILATTADTDDRVVPGHTFKYVAALQAADLGSTPKLVRVETRAGHGAGMPLDKVIALYADMWAIAAHWTGLEVDQNESDEIEF
ncbi:prolyl oligopeptidase family serine peptidase [Aquamicrobium zhengzhouense]|uniref:prolyl oligopeptidase n=1 Tax=Aquamicrobium zhengzhouense TaxID=2781738 RepID=A0ABS0SC01_9HYPH|nr:prolyl oligopeptidase family serine peptidase [Aquamicrobium zhengzhouense]MBI1620834.1 S9 family peptidase [Aquamicrobium zhengzhouense]